MIETHTSSDPRELVDLLAEDDRRAGARARLLELGPAAREAVLEGLGDGRWAVRRACAEWVAWQDDAEAMRAVVPLLRDPRAQVRGVAAWAVARSRGRSARLPDVVPLLLERVREDESIRVRRQCVMLLAYACNHPHLEGFFEDLLASERDPRLHRYAGLGLLLCREQARSQGGAPC